MSGGFFSAYGTSVVAGRDFQPLDFEPGKSNAMIVNEAFALNVFGGRNAIGRRIRIQSGEIDRYAGDTWYEIVGMVKNFGWQLPRPEEQSAMYRPSLPVVGNVSVLFMTGVEIYVDSVKVNVTASLLFQGHAELLGGLVAVTITIEAKGTISRANDRTDLAAQVTFGLDISIFLVINISFSTSWQEQRQIA